MVSKGIQLKRTKVLPRISGLFTSGGVTLMRTPVLYVIIREYSGSYRLPEEEFLVFNYMWNSTVRDDELERH